MKIDLHCHTKSIKQGDGKGRNVSLDLFKEKIMDADIKIVAITNHNTFDLKQYIEFKDAVVDFCQIWPGVEIDIAGSNDKKYHLIVVCNPDNVEQFNKKIYEMFDGKNLDKCVLDLTYVYNSLNECDVIYIPHFHKKPSISSEDMEQLEKLVNDKSRIFGETADNRSLGVFANHDYKVIIGSDVKDWSMYEKSTFAELKLPVENFNQFCLLSKRDQSVVETLLNKKDSYQLIASPHKTVSIDLKIFKDINIIFGQKGTGKSEILNTLYSSLVSQGVSCEKYTGSEKDDDFKKLLKTNDMERDLGIVNADDCKEEFKTILNWSDIAPTSFSNYIGWYNTKDNNANKSRMKITDANTIPTNEPKDYNMHLNDKESIKNTFNSFCKINAESYLTKEENDSLQQLLTKLKSNIIDIFKLDLIDIKAVDLTNHCINTIKSIADKNSDSMSKPSSTGFFEFAQNRIKLQKSITKILANISNKSFNSKELLGELEGKGKIYIRKLYRMLSNESKTTEFELGIKLLKEVKSLLENICSNISSDSIANLIDSLAEQCNENKIDSTKYFLGLSKQVVTEDDEEYSPSNGEKGILLLQKLLNSDKQAYFLDEPELGMGNSYIDSIIRPQIIGLAKMNKAIVVATHNANIAVRTLPYMSIFRVYENGKYMTYTGNPFNDQLVNIEDESDIRSWTLESLHTLEGGKEAFYERKNIYESNN